MSAILHAAYRRLKKNPTISKGTYKYTWYRRCYYTRGAGPTAYIIQFATEKINKIYQIYEHYVAFARRRALNPSESRGPLC